MTDNFSKGYYLIRHRIDSNNRTGFLPSLPQQGSTINHSDTVSHLHQVYTRCVILLETSPKTNQKISLYQADEVTYSTLISFISSTFILRLFWLPIFKERLLTSSVRLKHYMGVEPIFSDWKSDVIAVIPVMHVKDSPQEQRIISN